MCRTIVEKVTCLVLIVVVISLTFVPGFASERETSSESTPASAVQSATQAIPLAAGGAHTLVLKEDGTVWAWGSNYCGELGLGDATDRSSPVQVTSLGNNASSLAAGGYSQDVNRGGYSLALKEDGTVWAWGYNNYGQLGLGDTTSRSSPEQVTALGSSVKALAAGYYHSLALKGDGTVWACGFNSSGQLGLGDTTNRSSPVQVASLGNSVKALAAGYYHSLALQGDGTVWACGFNSSGQLGLGDTTNRSSPVQVTALGSNIEALTAGAWHSLALKGDGTVWPWGRNDHGQLGLGDTTNRSSPVQVTALGSNVEALAAGGVHTLVLKRDGTVWAWGGNSFGQLGLGDTTDRSSPVQVLTLLDTQYNQTLSSGWNMVTVGLQTLQSPAQLFGSGFKSIYRWEPIEGSYFTPQALEPGLGYWVKMAAAATITVQGTPVFSLTLPLSPGWNQVGSPFASSTPWSSVKVVKDTIEYTMSVAKVAGWIAAGYSWNGISYDAIDYASGSMGVGQGFWLKDNTTGISLLFRNPVSPKASITAGGTHTLALRGDGTVWAWGLNSSGQLGLGNTTSCSSPVQATSLGSQVKALAAGYYHSLALKEDGTVWAWGYNIHGQLGLGDFADRNNPVQITSLGDGVAALAAGRDHSLAIKNNGTVWAWGYNNYGQLGLGDTTNRVTPVQVTVLGNNVTTLTAGGWHTLALKGDGTAWAWGRNSDGQLGLGDTAVRSSPVQVSLNLNP